ncbi:MAG: hypothetical protein R3D34_18405 [Nitratireductor sp.]
MTMAAIHSLKPHATGLAALLVTAVVAMADAAMAHDAPSGFQYPPECCNDQDCAQIDPGEVTTGPGYYIWKDHHIAFSSPRIRQSPDIHFHGCETGHWGDTSGMRELTCFFVPQGM